MSQGNKTVIAKTVSDTNPVNTGWMPHDGFQFSAVLGVTGTLAGTWKIEASLASDNSNPVDVTAALQSVTTGSAIVNPSGSPLAQFVQAEKIVAGSIRITFTPSSGSGIVQVDRWVSS
jgi:hypothetical protein